MQDRKFSAFPDKSQKFSKPSYFLHSHGKNTQQHHAPMFSHAADTMSMLFQDVFRTQNPRK
jgi:hypothetical protein